MIVFYGVSNPSSLEPYLQKIYNYNTDNDIEFTFKLWNRFNSFDNHKVIDDNLCNLFCFSINGVFSKVIGYFFWCFIVFFDVLKAKNVNVVFCSRFEVVFSVFLASLFKDVKYVYLDRDAAHLSWGLSPVIAKLVFYVESYIAKKSLLHVVPSKYRNYTNSSNITILPNFPSSHLLSKARDCNHFNYLTSLKKSGFKLVYVNGWLVKTRGLSFINDFANMISKSDNILIVIAAGVESPLANELCKNKYSVYLGRLTPAESLSIYKHIDVVLSFYDTDIGINKVAEPNKWYDCLSMNKPFITNHGIITIENFKHTGLCKIIDYGDSSALYDLIVSENFPSPIDCNNQFGSSDDLTWDSFYKNIIDKVYGVL